jgi:diguanylate cyclase (GGDEF)-like protein
MTGRGAVVDAAGVGPRPVLDRSLTIQALHIEDDGVVWLGGSSGLWRLPYGARRAAPPPAPTLEHVFVNGRPIAKDGASGAVLRLPHGIERLRVQFSPNTFSSAVVTDFRLEPLDAQWNTSGRGQAAEYTSLPEGAYRLRIRSTHGAEQAETTWAFQVRPPWYRTAWAYAAEAMSGVTALLLLSHWRTRRLRRRSEELERAVIEQTAALQAANERLAALAWRDELTGLHNRRHFESVLAAEWAQARRASTPIALVLVDLDHFKRLNDSLGHVAGDRALRAVAAVIERCARGPGDVAARYGGDEFAVLLPGGRWERAHALAEEIREAVAALAAPHPGHPLGLMTVSVGVTAVPAPEGPEPTLVDAADRALYRAKAAGRNAVAA